MVPTQRACRAVMGTISMVLGRYPIFGWHQYAALHLGDAVSS